MSGKLDSWAIRWYWSVFMENGIVLYPPESLVNNTGLDGSGTHGGGVFSRFNRLYHGSSVKCPDLPSIASLNPREVEKAISALQWQNGGLKTLCLNMLQRLF